MSIKEKRRFTLFFVVAILLPALAIIIRLFFLQFLQQKELEKMAKGMYTKEEILEEVRGTIYDRAGRELAMSIEVDSLYADPSRITSKELTAQKLAAILNINKDRLLAKLRSPSHFVWIKRKIEPAERLAIEAAKIEGLGFITEYKRVYPRGRLAAHLLGFVGMDNHGLEGIELYFDRYLRGEVKRVGVIRDARGKILRVLPTEDRPSLPVKGCDLILTIDEVIQHTAEQELKEVVAKYKAKRGTIIVMDSDSGRILALAIEPSFDPNRFWEFDEDIRENWVITKAFEPGSTLKPLIFAAAIEEGVIDTNERVFCPGSIVVAGRQIHCYKRHKGLTLGEALEVSCNVGTIETALRLNPQKFYEYIRSFGFGNITGITLRGEARGILRRPSNWSSLSQASLAIGQEIFVTPLQLAIVTAALANGGQLMEPLVVHQIRDQTGRIVKEFKPTCIRRILSPETLRSLRGLLEGVVLRGTGQAAQISGYRVYGKTGTAQKFDQDLGRYSRDRSISSFIGWAEAGRGRILVLVIIDEPEGISWGSVVAAPSFRRVVEKTLPYLGIFPEKSLVKLQTPLKEAGKVVSPTATTVMPDVCGLTMRRVHQILSPYGLSVVFEGSGIATSQVPPPGTELMPGMVVKVQFKGG